MQTQKVFCEKLLGETCTVVNETCFRLRERAKCEYVGCLRWLESIEDQCLPLARGARLNIKTPFLKAWKQYAQHPKAGNKRVIATPIENELRDIIKLQLSPLGVSVSPTAKVFRVWKDCKIIADALLEKEEYPTTILSFKSWVGSEQVRETFAYAYLAKSWYGQKDIRVYEIGGTKAGGQAIDDLVSICRPWVDGVFYLTTVPYLDEMIQELKDIYS